MPTVFAILVMIVIVGWLWFYVARPILEDYNLIGPREIPTYTVKDYQLPAAPPVRYVAPVATEKPQTAQTDGADGQTDRLSVADEWLDRLEVDRTRATWVELMVYIGYSGSEVRALLKGDNAAIGKDVDAARKKLGMEPTTTPIAGRPTDARYPERPEVELAS